jgi:hypothetical protein
LVKTDRKTKLTVAEHNLNINSAPSHPIFIAVRCNWQ